MRFEQVTAVNNFKKYEFGVFDTDRVCIVQIEGALLLLCCISSKKINQVITFWKDFLFLWLLFVCQIVLMLFHSN